MKESQLKPINEEELPEIKEENKEETNNTTTNKEKEIVQSLPSWSIEPPIEIKRG
jgi:hypothetical protein